MQRCISFCIAIALVIALTCCSFKNTHGLVSSVDPITPSIEMPQHQCTATDNNRLKQISDKARSLLQNIAVHEYTCSKKVGKKNISLPGREIALAACSPTTHEISTVIIKLCYEIPEELIVATPGYRVHWKGGKGITRFTFDISNSDTHEHLLLLDSKHWMQESRSPAYYFPYSDDMLTTSVVSAGITTLNEIIDEAMTRLREKNIRSLTFDEQLLGDIFPHDLFYNLALIEQMDDDEFFSECPILDTLPQENRIFANCPEYAAYKVLVHYARNEKNAFSYVRSRAGAGGAMQFMPATYAMVRRQYWFVDLDPSFEKGTSDIINAVKAAACLLDFNMLTMHPGIKYEFVRNPRLGSIYLMAAYNGGPKRAERLYRSLGVRKKCCTHIEQVPSVNREIARETNGYLIKYVGLWEILDNLATETQAKTSE
jgi:hypothetical protein